MRNKRIFRPFSLELLLTSNPSVCVRSVTDACSRLPHNFGVLLGMAKVVGSGDVQLSSDVLRDDDFSSHRSCSEKSPFPTRKWYNLLFLF